MTLKNNPNIEGEKTISQEAKNYELLEKMVEPLVKEWSEWSDQRKEVSFKTIDWYEITLFIKKSGIEKNHSEEIKVSLIRKNAMEIKGMNYYFIKWYTDRNTQYKVNSIDTEIKKRKNIIRNNIPLKDIQRILDDIEKHIELYLKSDKKEKRTEISRENNIHLAKLKQDIYNV